MSMPIFTAGASLSTTSERDRSGSGALFAALYAELHRIARRELSRSHSPITLGATSLLHQAYLELSDRDGAAFPDRHRFMAYAARVMRGLIVDYVRNRRAQKRGGLFELTSLEIDVGAAGPRSSELSRLSDALDSLTDLDPPLAEVVDLKFFCGLSFAEIAAMQNVSERTVQRNWQKARLYLHRSMCDR